ncbi:MAG: beta-ketoacyl synthase chain length factor [Gammaproteobacteria bacterium]|nr:beta-ketoacyl synthase chain length factor [Gammaproteobacteria bacterium]
MQLAAYLDGVGVLGPGMADWPAAARVLARATPWRNEPTVLPAPQCLPSAERRRTGAPVRLTLAVGLEASASAGVDPATLATVFSSSGGDGQNCHEICQVLASAERQVSPTRFHNSVHNAAAGYWGIATGATAASNALCAFDGSFAAGLLEAVTQVVVERKPVLLIAYDTGYPEPLRSARPIPDAFGVALVLSAARGPASLAGLEIALGERHADRMEDEALEALRAAVPAARSLSLLGQVARGTPGSIVLDYLGHTSLSVQITPCR